MDLGFLVLDKQFTNDMQLPIKSMRFLILNQF